jgi:DNA-binding transcriptional ArsR family regulator
VIELIDVDGAPAPEEMTLVSVLSALSDPVRLGYVQVLARHPDEVACGDVLAETDFRISKSTLSHHLRVLREAGLTHTRVVGVRRFVRLRRDEVEGRFPGLLAAVCGPGGHE